MKLTRSGSSTRVACLATLLAAPLAAQIPDSATLLASDPGASTQLGLSVAVEGDTVAVGKPLDDVGGENNLGSVYVFTRPGGGWSGTLTEVARLVPPDGEANWRFGESLALSAGTLYVGAPGSGPSAKGAVYVYEEPPGGWSGAALPVAKLYASGSDPGSGLGTSVDVDGGTLVAGAPSDDFNVNTGSAYVFVEPPGGWSGLVTETAKLKGFGGLYLDFFGQGVGVSGDTIVVGAPSYLIAQQPGKAYVFRRPAGGWPAMVFQYQTLLPSNSSVNDGFGTAVDIDGDTLVVGADNKRTTYVFRDEAGSFVQKSRLRPSDGTVGASMGYAVAIEGSLVVAGAPYGVEPGGVYVFREPAGGWSGPEFEVGKLVTSGTGEHGRCVAIEAGVVVSGDPGHASSAGAGLVHVLDRGAATFRNAGTNPASLVVDPPVLGGSLEATVDLSLTGHASALLFAFESAADVPLAGGQTLLCLDAGAGELLTGAGVLAPGPSATFSFPIPLAPGILSRALTVQAAHVFAVTPFALTNAWDLTVGL